LFPVLCAVPHLARLAYEISHIFFHPSFLNEASKILILANSFHSHLMSLLHVEYHTQVIPHYSHTPHVIRHCLRASGDGDGFETISSVGVGESTSLNMQRKSPTMARTKSKFAGSKKKTSKAATSTSEEPPIPESVGRKHPPEQFVALEQQKRTVTTLWQRGKSKRVVVADVPTGKDTGPPPNKNSVFFCKQCGAQCICPLSALRKPCCDRETHVSLNNVGEYVVFPAETVHQGFFSAVNKATFLWIQQ
jgi:hypothetical protein